jgi:hypothetical protein
MHARRDNRIHVENSRSKRIDKNKLESIGHSRNIELGNNQHEVIGCNLTLTVMLNIFDTGFGLFFSSDYPDGLFASIEVSNASIAVL